MVQVPFPFMPETSAAVLSECGAYRYSLSRSLDQFALHQGTHPDRRRCLFIMLNPSTADALANDPTIEKCMKLARHWGYHVLDVGNLYAYRATDPKELKRAAIPAELGMNIIGPDNDKHLGDLARAADIIVLGWGANSPMPERANQVIDVLQNSGYPSAFPALGPELYCIKQNKDGSPIHPLYQRDDSRLVPYVRNG